MRSRKLRIHLKIAEIIQERSITMEKLSHMADLSYTTVRDVVKRPNHTVSILTLERIARALKVNVSDLYEVIDDL